MHIRTPGRQLLTVALVVVVLSLTGITPVGADERYDGDGTGDACLDRTNESYTELGALESNRIDGSVRSETDLIGQFQAVVANLDYELDRMGCYDAT